MYYSRVVAMNLFNVLSLKVRLRIVVVTCEVVNYYHVYKYLCYCICVFMYACQLCRMIGYDRTGSVFLFCLSVDRSLSTHCRSNWFVFEIP